MTIFFRRAHILAFSWPLISALSDALLVLRAQLSEAVVDKVRHAGQQIER